MKSEMGESVELGVVAIVKLDGFNLVPLPETLVIEAGVIMVLDIERLP